MVKTRSLDSSGGRGRPREKAVMAAAVPAPSAPVTRITSPVSVQIRRVSKTTAVMEIRPCSQGRTPRAEAAAMGAVPRPASWEKTPLLTPAAAVPKRPPPAAAGVKASRRTLPQSSGRSRAWRKRIQMQQSP